MKLLIITQKIDANDTILGFFHRWVEEFSRHCEQVTVIALGVGEYHLPENVRVLSLGKERGVSRLAYLFNFYRFILRERENYDAVFVHMNPVYAILGGFFWRVYGKKIALWYTHKHVNAKLRIAEQLAHIVLTASPESFRLASKKLRVVGHGIDTDLFAPSVRAGTTDTLRILTVGRISPAKDYATLIRAVALLQKDGVPFSARIVGSPATEKDAVYAEGLRAEVRTNALMEQVLFSEGVHHDAVPALLGGADVFVNTSRTGSVDKAVLEAMACETPVLTSNEAFAGVLGGERARLHMFPAGDARALSQKLLHIHRLTPEQRKRVSADLRAIIIKEHNLKTLITRIMNEYETSR